VIKSSTKLRNVTWGVAAFAAAILWSAISRADILLNDPSKTAGWEVSTSGRVDSYLSWVYGRTVSITGFGNLIDPTGGSNARYRLVGPQVGIQGNPSPSGPILDMQNDTKLSAPRVRGGFASTILAFTIRKQITPTVNVMFKLGLWAGIQNSVVGGVRQENDVGNLDWRDQYMKIEGPFGILWAGRLLGLFNRGGMRLDWYLMHQIGVGHPCNVDSGGTTSCGATGVGSLHPSRNAQLAYSTPEIAGFQITGAVLDPAMVDQSWNRTPLPRFEFEATYHRGLGGTNEVNAWANGLSQVIGRTTELPPQLMPAVPGVPADATRSIFGLGGGAWARVSSFSLGGTVWGGKGLGTAFAFGNTDIDDIGTLRKHLGYLGVGNYRLGNFEIAAEIGVVHVTETAWDANPTNPNPVSVIKEVRGLSGLLAYHFGPLTFSIDGMNIRNTWARGEVQHANVVSAGVLGEW
jgi:Gram-negative porin